LSESHGFSDFEFTNKSLPVKGEAVKTCLTNIRLTRIDVRQLRPVMFPFVYEINIAGWFHLIYFGLVIPIAAVLHRRKFSDAKKPLPNRVQFFQSTTVGIVVLGLISLLMARVQLIELFPLALPPLKAVIAGGIVLVTQIVLMRPLWRKAVARRDRVLYFYMPTNAAERTWWIVVAVTAGIFEEISWRGVQAGLLGNLTGSLVITMLACAACFGIAHASQGWVSVAIVAGFGIAFHSLVWLSGSLYVAMAVHIAYDITAGIMYGRLGREMGYNLDPGTALTSSDP
jgi:membrane protease YdiL (CAAX protease family)